MTTSQSSNIVKGQSEEYLEFFDSLILKKDDKRGTPKTNVAIIEDDSAAGSIGNQTNVVVSSVGGHVRRESIKEFNHILEREQEESKKAKAALEKKLTDSKLMLDATNREKTVLMREKTALEKENVELTLQYKREIRKLQDEKEAVGKEKSELIQENTAMRKAHKLQLDAVNEEKKILLQEKRKTKKDIKELRSLTVSLSRQLCVVKKDNEKLKEDNVGSFLIKMFLILLALSGLWTIMDSVPIIRGEF